VRLAVRVVPGVGLPGFDLRKVVVYQNSADLYAALR
jgi:hypothetical protein